MWLHSELKAMDFMLNISTYDGDIIDNESQGYGTMNSHNGSTYAGSFHYGEYHSPGKLVIESKEYMGHYENYP
jgi:hypothetical protein